MSGWWEGQGLIPSQAWIFFRLFSFSNTLVVHSTAMIMFTFLDNLIRKTDVCCRQTWNLVQKIHRKLIPQHVTLLQQRQVKKARQKAALLIAQAFLPVTPLAIWPTTPPPNPRQVTANYGFIVLCLTILAKLVAKYLRVLYSTTNHPQPQMIPRRQMIPKMDRKWSSTVSDPQSRPQMIRKEK